MGRITKDSSGRTAEHRYEQYQLLLVPSVKTLFQVEDLLADMLVLSERGRICEPDAYY